MKMNFGVKINLNIPSHSNFKTSIIYFFWRDSVDILGFIIEVINNSVYLEKLGLTNCIINHLYP